MMSSYGPSLPPNFVKSDISGRHGDENPQSDLSKSRMKGAEPSTEGKITKSIIGPILPVFVCKQNETDETDEGDDSEFVGPQMPKAGPISEKIEVAYKAEELEARAESMKRLLTGEVSSSSAMQRESWMVELPPCMAPSFGLVPRSFRTTSVELGDQSVWTDTPSDRQAKLNAVNSDRKELLKSDAIAYPAPDETELQAEVDMHNKRTRPKSLMEMHKEKRQKLADGPVPRRPFDRERDLALHRTDPNDKKKLLEQAKTLNSKFSSGQGKKFL